MSQDSRASTASYHSGELALQERVGTTKWAAGLKSKIHGHLTQKVSELASGIPVVFIGFVEGNNVWCSPVCGDPGFVQTVDPTHIRICVAGIPRPDPFARSLERARSDGCAPFPISINLLKFRTRERSRVIGYVERIVWDAGSSESRLSCGVEQEFKCVMRSSAGHDDVKLQPSSRQTASAILSVGGATAEIVVHVKESFQICPKYIVSRQPHRLARPRSQQRSPATARTSSELSEAQCFWIARADTFMIASAYRDNDDVDCSHRGGYPGFVRVQNKRTLVWPDYAGTGMFQVLGNVVVNAKLGLLFLNFDDMGHYLQLTGRAEVVFDSRAQLEGGQGRFVRFEVQSVNEMRAPSQSIYRFTLVEVSPYTPCLVGDLPLINRAALRHFEYPSVHILDELRLHERHNVCLNINEYTFATHAVHHWLPGQYGVFRIVTNVDAPVVRNWTISSVDMNQQTLDITVKNEPNGCGSKWLRDHASSEMLELLSIQGSFTCFKCRKQTLSVHPSRSSLDMSGAPSPTAKLLFVTGGVGFTPAEAMLRGIVSQRYVLKDQLIGDDKTPLTGSGNAASAGPGADTSHTTPRWTGWFAVKTVVFALAAAVLMTRLSRPISVALGILILWALSALGDGGRFAPTDAATSATVDAVLLHSCRDWEDIPWHWLLPVMRSKWLTIGRLRVVFFFTHSTAESVAALRDRCVRALGPSDRADPTAIDAEFGRVSVAALKRQMADVSSRTCFMCGPRGMTQAVTDALVTLGVPGHRILTESFEY